MLKDTQPRQLPMRRVVDTSQNMRLAVADIETGTTIDEVLHPLFFAMSARYLIPGTLIFCRWDDNSSFGTLYVQAAGEGKVSTTPVLGGFQVFDEVDASDLQPETVDGVRVEHAGLTEKWRVVRESDGQVLKTMLPNRGEARRQRTNYLKSLRAA